MDVNEEIEKIEREWFDKGEQNPNAGFANEMNEKGGNLESEVMDAEYEQIPNDVSVNKADDLLRKLNRIVSNYINDKGINDKETEKALATKKRNALVGIVAATFLG